MKIGYTFLKRLANVLTSFQLIPEGHDAERTMYMLFNDHTFPFSMILVNITIDLMFSCQIIRQNAFRVLSFGPRNKKKQQLVE